jgi:hypothetical protein
MPLKIPTVGGVLRSLINPEWRKRRKLYRNPKATLLDRMNYDVLEYNQYAYGMYYAAKLAQSLGIKEVTGIEFGVCDGDGLRSMEQIGWCIQQELGVRYDLYGFDTGVGMPPPTDPRDTGYLWTTGLFAPQRDLSTFLKRAKMVIGDVAQTVPRFLEEKHAPVAFVSVDVDYYTSTVPCLKMFEASTDLLLPRVYVYLDDIIGDDYEVHSKYSGELAAVEEFNERNKARKIAPINGLRWKRKFPAPWNDQMFVAHIFDHPRFGEYVNPNWKPPERRAEGAGGADAAASTQRSDGKASPEIVTRGQGQHSAGRAG